MTPDGFEAGPVQTEDAAEVALLMNEFHRFHLGDAMDADTEEDVRGWWAGLDCARDTVVFREAGTGRIGAIGVVETRERVLDMDGYVHPELTGRGLGSAILSWGEAGVGSRGLDALRSGYLSVDVPAERLFRERGYEYVRSFYRMLADLAEPPPSPSWPENCTVDVRAGDDDDRYFYEVLEEAFAEHWGHVARSYETWLERTRARNPDLSLWYLARMGGEPAAAAICGQQYGMGWIGIIGVRPVWRRRGIAQALLLQAFGDLYGRGERRMGLGVDASNETGATRVYESVGMRAAWRADLCERPGTG